MELIKSRLSILLAIIVAVDSSLEDKKISFGEWIRIATKAVGIYKVVRDFKEIVSEFEGATQTELDELTDYFAQEFDLRNDKVEGYIEQIIGVLLTISSVVFFANTIKRQRALPEYGG